MRSLLVLLLTSIILSACSKGNEAPQEKKEEIERGPMVRVMTYNIHIGNPPSKPSNYRDLNAIAEVIKTQKPDLVALQEVDVNTSRSGVNVDQANELAKLTGMHVFYTKAIDFDGGQFGDAVLSRYPILESKRYELPVTTQLGGETRSVAIVTVETNGIKFQFASTHLDHLSNEGNRVLQATELNKVVKDLKLPLIIAGDMNASPTSNPINILKQELTWGCKSSCPFTFPATGAKSTLDYIFVSNTSKFIFRTYNILNETYASDHLPVIADIELKNH
ncbi:MAG: endonuclease/exonuclease/phosphatase family protein [Sphingobacteriaceae bacterium]